MNAKISLKLTSFLKKRLIEIIGIVITLFSIFLFLALASYSPNDPNFWYSNTKIIKNLFGFRGSVVADFGIQSIGIMAFLFSANIFFWGIQILKTKNFDNFITKVFFQIYILSLEQQQ